MNKLAIICSAISFLFCQLAKAESTIGIDTSKISPYIFRIISKDCDLCPRGKDKLLQTGFRVQGVPGVITALHGVVGRQSISAVNDSMSEPLSNLEIVKVDIKNDVALLSSDKFNSGKTGLKPSGQSPDYKKIYSIGYPLTLGYQKTTSHLSIHAVEKLSKLLDDQVRNIAKDRNSPDIDSEVLSIEGQLLPGHSGAPILNSKNKVIGIASGGLQEGTVGISWAIPYNQIDWKDKASQQQELTRLAKLEAPLSSFTAFKASSGALLEWQEPRARKMMTWKEANDYVADKNSEGLMGYHDWRLPAIGELQELAKFIKNSPGSYSDTDKLYWSSEDLGAVEAKVVNLGNAKMEWYDIDKQVATRSKDSKFSVRLVRSLIQ